MLLPRFSLRMSLVLLTSAACFSVVAREAVNGRLWAVGLAVALASILAALATYACFFLACTLFGRLVGIEQIVAKTSRGAILRDEGEGVTPIAHAAASSAEEAS